MPDKQLLMVAKWEKEKEDKLARDFQQAQQQWVTNKNKLAGLENYRLDYLRQIQRKGADGVKALSYGQHQSFIGKLDKACEEQNKLIARAKLVADQRRELWLKQQRKRKAVDMLLDKKLQQRELKELKEEQKLLDELSIQKFIRARA
ncbi:flagellar export protein FliJ [Neptunicella sp. SCSIO 80796]|uniref:flagellar export protein FliJ n=1 Tax=Neptunicella plasticusilytica TaxID=3117012 RepID=UPI003A4D3D10